MATVIKARVNSSRGTAYEVFLDNGAPSSDGLLLDSKGSNIDFKINSDDPDGHIVASKATIQFSITNSTEKAVFDGLIEANELQYRLRVLREGVLEWVGFVLLDQVNADFGGYPYFFKVGATDGLSRLKDIDYTQGALTEFATVKEHLFNILEQVPLGDYFATSAEYLRINSTLYPEGMTPGTTVNTLEKTRLGFKALRTVDNRGNVTYVKQYDALLEVLKHLNARIIFSKGRYTITEINSYARPLTTTTFFRYDQQGTALTPETQANWTPSTIQIGSSLDASPAVALAGGKVSYLPPLKAVDLTYKHYSRQNLFPAYNGRTLAPEASTSYQEILSFGTDAGAGTIAISGNVAGAYTAQATILPANVQVYVRLAVSLVIVDADDNNSGTSLERGVVITSNGFSYQPVEWVDGNVGKLAYFMLPMPPRNATNSGTAGFTINTPVVPRSGTLRFAITHRGVFAEGTEYDPNTVTVRLQEFFMESLLAGSISDQYNYTNFRPETGASGFNSVVLTRELLFGDGPGDNTFGRIEYTENGTDWERTNEWRRWSGESYLNATAMAHGAMISQMILALQESPREQLDIAVVAPTYYPEFMFGCGNKLYLMKSGRLDLDRDVWRGRWFEIAANFTDNVVTGTPSVTNPTVFTDNTVIVEPELPTGNEGGGTTPPGVVPPGVATTGMNTVQTYTGSTAIDEGVEIGNLAINNLTDTPFMTGDIIVVTNPLTGETLDVELLYDSGYIEGSMTDAGAIPFYTENGTTWLVPSTTEIEIVPVTPGADFPAGSFVQPNPQFTAQLQAILRKDHYDFQIFDYDTTVTTGFVGPFWRPGNRIGWGIRKVHFAFAQDEGATAVKVNLKYYDATGLRYTVATFNSDGLGGIVDAYADVAAGYYRVEVETITGTAPKGLTVSIEMIKTT